MVVMSSAKSDLKPVEREFGFDSGLAGLAAIRHAEHEADLATLYLVDLTSEMILSFCEVDDAQMVHFQTISSGCGIPFRYFASFLITLALNSSHSITTEGLFLGTGAIGQTPLPPNQGHPLLTRCCWARFVVLKKPLRLPVVGLWA